MTEVEQNKIDYERYTGVTVNGITNVPDQIIMLGKRLIRVEKNGKKPLDNWSEVSRDITDSELSEHLRSKGNYGIKTGNGLIVVDLDSPEMVAKKDKFPRTYTVKTGRGYHLYYKVNQEVKTRHCEGFDILSDLAYVVGANSVNKDGVAYTVVDDTDIVSVDFEKLQLLIEQELLTITKTILHPTPTSTPNSTNKINLFEDERFASLEYYPRIGISFIEVFDIFDLEEVNRYIDNSKTKCKYYLTKGAVHKSPINFEHENVNLLFPRLAVQSIKRAGNNGENHKYFLMLRTTERLYATVSVSENQYNEYQSMKEDEVINKYPTLRSAFKTKLKNFEKKKKARLLIEELLAGTIDERLTKDWVNYLVLKAVEINKTDEEIHLMLKNFYQEEYDFSESQAQINYSKRKLET